MGERERQTETEKDGERPRACGQSLEGGRFQHTSLNKSGRILLETSIGTGFRALAQHTAPWGLKERHKPNSPNSGSWNYSRNAGPAKRAARGQQKSRPVTPRREPGVWVAKKRPERLPGRVVRGGGAAPQPREKRARVRNDDSEGFRETAGNRPAGRGRQGRCELGLSQCLQTSGRKAPAQRTSAGRGGPQEKAGEATSRPLSWCVLSPRL